MNSKLYKIITKQILKAVMPLASILNGYKRFLIAVTMENLN